MKLAARRLLPPPSRLQRRCPCFLCRVLQCFRGVPGALRAPGQPRAPSPTSLGGRMCSWKLCLKFVQHCTTRRVGIAATRHFVQVPVGRRWGQSITNFPFTHKLQPIAIVCPDAFFNSVGQTFPTCSSATWTLLRSSRERRSPFVLVAVVLATAMACSRTPTLSQGDSHAHHSHSFVRRMEVLQQPGRRMATQHITCL